MSTFLERLVEEHSDLGLKLDKLGSFITGEKFNDIEVVQKSLLRIQYEAMNTYYACLSERIDNLK